MSAVAVWWLPSPTPTATISDCSKTREIVSTAANTKAKTPRRHAADSHDLIRVHGARVNNLKDVSIDIPKRRLTGAARPDPQGVCEGQRREAVAIQRELRGRLPELQRRRRHLHRADDHGQCRLDLRGMRGQALRCVRARVQARRPRHHRGARDVDHRGHGVLRRRRGEGAGRAQDSRVAGRRGSRVPQPRPAAHPGSSTPASRSS
jgi:hypothetical protein